MKSLRYWILNLELTADYTAALQCKKPYMKGPFKAMTFFNNSPGQLSTSLLHSDILLTAGNMTKV